MKTFLAFVVLLVLTAATTWTLASYVKYRQHFSNLESTFYALNAENQATYNNTWEMVQRETGFPDTYESTFKEIYITIITKNTAQESVEALLAWINERIAVDYGEVTPPLTIDTISSDFYSAYSYNYTFVNSNIKFMRDLQTKLTRLTTTVPSSWFLRGKTIPPSNYYSGYNPTVPAKAVNIHI